jgi:O-methyltransferase involved in polyketide biosynthesis
MQTGQPSETARGAAAHRAVHQTLEAGVIFTDPFAVAILDDDTRARLPEMAADPSHRPMRHFIRRFVDNMCHARREGAFVRTSLSNQHITRWASSVGPPQYRRPRGGQAQPTDRR